MVEEMRSRVRFHCAVEPAVWLGIVNVCGNGYDKRGTARNVRSILV